MKIVITESQLRFIRRYQEIKDWVKSDYKHLLRQGYSPREAKEITIDHSPSTYLDDKDTDIGNSRENIEKLGQFIEDNFEDLIS